MERKTIKVTVGGKEIVFETGRIGRQANGSVLVQMGETIVFTSACAASEAFDPMFEWLWNSSHTRAGFESW